MVLAFRFHNGVRFVTSRMMGIPDSE